MTKFYDKDIKVFLEGYEIGILNIKLNLYLNNVLTDVVVLIEKNIKKKLFTDNIDDNKLFFVITSSNNRMINVLELDKKMGSISKIALDSGPCHQISIYGNLKEMYDIPYRGMEHIYVFIKKNNYKKIVDLFSFHKLMLWKQNFYSETHDEELRQEINSDRCLYFKLFEELINHDDTLEIIKFWDKKEEKEEEEKEEEEKEEEEKEEEEKEEEEKEEEEKEEEEKEEEEKEEEEKEEKKEEKKEEENEEENDNESVIIPISPANIVNITNNVILKERNTPNSIITSYINTQISPEQEKNTTPIPQISSKNHALSLMSNPLFSISISKN